MRRINVLEFVSPDGLIHPRAGQRKILVAACRRTPNGEVYKDLRRVGRRTCTQIQKVPIYKLIEKAGGDDGTRTRGLCRDRG
jgi:hypothetical protein